MIVLSLGRVDVVKGSKRYTHFGIKLVNSSYSFFYSPFLYCIPDLHPFLYRGMVDIGWQTRLASELYGGVREPFQKEVVEYQGVQVAISSALMIIEICVL